VLKGLFPQWLLKCNGRIILNLHRFVGRDSSVSVATSYGLDGTGVESHWGAKFLMPVQTVPGAHPVPYTVGTGSFQEVNRPGRSVNHPPPCSVEVKERVELYLYSPSGHSWPVLGRNLPFLTLYRSSSLHHSLRNKFKRYVTEFLRNSSLCERWVFDVRYISFTSIDYCCELFGLPIKSNINERVLVCVLSCVVGVAWEHWICSCCNLKSRPMGSYCS